MGILSSLFGGASAKGDCDRFVSERAFAQNLERQIAMSPQTLSQLREYGVTDDSRLKLEYFFYTNSAAKADALAKRLASLDYSVESRTSASDENLLLVTGWTIPIQMPKETVVEWTKYMTRLGFEHDCEFDGWGTNPSQ